MCAQFTDDDLEKRVENANGETIGAITAVEGEIARVEPRTGVMDSVRAALGWSGTHETVSIRDEAVDEITDDVIRLGAESVEEDALAESTADESEIGGGEPDDTATGEGIESDEATARASKTDRLEGTERGSTDAAANPAEPAPTEEADLEDELNRGTKIEPPPAVDEGDAAETNETADVDAAKTADGMDVGAAETADGNDGSTPGVERRNSLETDPVTERDEHAEWSGPDESDSDEDPVGTEPMNAIDETSEDAERETKSMDLADELGDGVDLEAVDGGTDVSDRTPETDVGDELTRGSDLESVAEPTEGAAGSSEQSGTEEMDLAAELDRDTDIDAVEESPSSDAFDHETADDSTEEMDLTEELNRSVDLESAAETEHGTETAVDPDSPPEPRTDAETASEAPVPRPTEPASHAALETEPALEHRPDDPAETDERAETDDSAAGGMDRRSRERGETAAPFDAMLDAQRTAITGSQQLFEGGLEIQRRASKVALATLGGQVAFQRQSLELLQAATTPVRAADTKEAADARESAETASEQRQFERRLELIDGLDSMYRERLEDAGITTLDDLAYADVDAVAEAADVTEKRAESWIEQAGA